MKKFATLSSKGQVVIPKEIRKFWALKKNMKLIFELVDNNILIKPLQAKYSSELKQKLTNFSVDPNFRKNWEEATKRRTKGW